MKVAVIGAGAIGGLVAGYLVEKCAYLKDVPVISVQNGVRAERIIAERLGAQRLFPSIVMFGATYLAPGKIVHNFEGDWIMGQANAGPNDMLPEGLDLVTKANIALSSLPTFPVERLSHLVSMPLNEAAKIFSTIMLNLSKEPLYGSILQSIRRKRPSEIDCINGEFVNLAASVGQKAPLNEMLVQMVHDVERGGRFLSEAELISQTQELMS